jgi:5-methyltetrahydrofolate--homocysteine methyltransferase
VNLGIKVPISEMIAKAVEVDADAIGMSGLLVKSTLVMRENLEELNDRGLERIPVLLGGAALTRTYVERDLRQVYKGRVFYGRDAFEGLAVMERLRELKRSGDDDPDFGRAISERKVYRRDPAATSVAVEVEERPRRSPEVATDNPVFRPPFVGSEIARGIPLEEIARYLNETALFRHQWGFRPEGGEDDAAMRERARQVLRTQLDLAKAEGTLVPQVVWGYFPAASDGDDLVVFADEQRRRERVRFHLPRQGEPPWLCIADFFRPLDADQVDWVAFFVTTMGRKVSERARELFEANRYQDYLFLHGLGVEMTEALAELWHRRIREEWGFADEDGPTLAGLFRQRYRGGRYSFGYPACPDLEDNAKVVDVLEAGRIGVTITDNFQLEPEQTTLALVCHHPQAKYFVVR